jgi:pimeloyl-ACP methyl ester carboxylesterase
MWASGSTGWGSMIPASIGGYQWRAALDELAALRTGIAPDLMGLGFTEARAGQDPELRGTGAGRLPRPQSDRQVDLVGKDTGRGVSQNFAARYPDKVRPPTLTNCESVIYGRTRCSDSSTAHCKPAWSGRRSRSWYAIRVPPRRSSPACTSIRRYSTCSYSRCISDHSRIAPIDGAG